MKISKLIKLLDTLHSECGDIDVIYYDSKHGPVIIDGVETDHITDDYLNVAHGTSPEQVVRLS